MGPPRDDPCRDGRRGVTAHSLDTLFLDDSQKLPLGLELRPARLQVACPGPLDVLHQPGDEHVDPVAHGVHVHLEPLEVGVDAHGSVLAHHGRQAELPHPVHTAHAAGGLASRLNGGQQQGHEDADDGNDDEQLDERKGGPQGPRAAAYNHLESLPRQQ